MNFESAVGPYQPILKRRLSRRRLFCLTIVMSVALPYAWLRGQLDRQPQSERVFDDVATTIALRYYDASYHGVPWRSLIGKYRPLVISARNESERYALLRSLVARLGDSHTAIFSPDESRGYERSAPSRVAWKIAGPGIGYLRLAAFPNNMPVMLRWAFEQIGTQPHLILDLRGNAGGYIDAVEVTAGAFLPSGTLIATGVRRYPWFGRQHFTADGSAGTAYRGKLVVLVDGATQSGAETLAEALRYYGRGTVLGTRTAGKVLGVDAEERLEDGGLLRVATLDIIMPNGSRLERRGVLPDVVVRGGSAQIAAAMATLKR